MADYYTLLTTAGIAYETACKAAGTPIKLSKMSVGDGGGAVYNPDATATALKREVWRGDINALLQDESNSSWLIAELTIPESVGGWYVREAGIWTDTGILYAIIKYPESYKPILATGSAKEFYVRAIFQTSNASSVTLVVDETVVKATRAWVTDYVADELAKLDAKQSVRVATTANITLSGAQSIDGVAVIAGQRVLVKNQTTASENGIYVAATGGWARAADADSSAKVTPGLTVYVEEGVTQADTIWKLVTDGTITLGTTALTFFNITKGFAPLDSPALLGSPTAPTPAQSNFSTQLATTAFVKNNAGNFAGLIALTGSTTLTAAAAGTHFVTNVGSGDVVVTLPVANSVMGGTTLTFAHSSGSMNSFSLVTQAGDALLLDGLSNTISPYKMVNDETVSLVSTGGIAWKIVYSNGPAFLKKGISQLKGIARFLASGTFTVPPGVTTLYVSGCAGGGGGGGGAGYNPNFSGGGGGGGSGYIAVRAPINVTPGQVYNITIGGGGAAGASGANTAAGTDGGTGGNTSMVLSGAATGVISLAGGGGGRGGGGAALTGAGGAAGSPGGSCGTDGRSASIGGDGGAGGNGPFGIGGGSGRAGAGLGASATGGVGFGTGGGGGGACYNTSGAGGSGSAGMPGFLTIEW
ncbi:phage tail protein [Pseudomonas luteola]|uniref:phage tail protein n=1 Tax=Pseudomonas luteola TaxID=47886 RepID=UPI001FD2DE91|nr:phage tail protein [Pseudomonas zeshuii]